jgi:hypothetical protein
VKIVLCCRPLCRPCNFIPHAYLFNLLPEAPRGCATRGMPGRSYSIVCEAPYFKLEPSTIASNGQTIVALLPWFGKAIGNLRCDYRAIPTNECFARKNASMRRKSPLSYARFFLFEGEMRLMIGRDWGVAGSTFG